MFIEACKKFASQEGLQGVRVPKANTLTSFLNPYGRALTEDRKKAVHRIRRDMELIYDGNALGLGLVPDGDWFKWENARSIRGYQPTLMGRVSPVAVSVALTAATTAILFQMHASQTTPHRLVYFYLLPLFLITILYTDRIALVCVGLALLCADYFLQDPIYSFYTSEYYDLIWFAALASVEIATIRKLLPRNGGGAVSSR
jgi:K+-sensing histidine kinase KdpD